jgi:hypothetical protein
LPRFEEIKGVFWSKGPSFEVQPPLADEVVAHAESVLGVRLPHALIELLRLQNGGSVSEDFDAFPTSEPTTWADDHVPFDHMLGIGDRENIPSLLDAPYLVEEWGLPSLVVPLSGDGHYWVALDYRKCGPAGEPSVAWFDEGEPSAPWVATGVPELQLARDFRSFVEGLLPMDSFDDDA